ncbi:hypothetical protein DFH11DRAFT_1595282 [Phellopilus nigrolimitatus]|nr:hypothetical protein DFH11DRAFT_1595282 [Phellopilus nigrolimitatus]
MFDETAAWGAPVETSSADIVKDTIKKDQTIKEIIAAQEDLRVLMAKVQSVQGDIEKLGSGNATLQMYIDNLTMQMAKRR